MNNIPTMKRTSAGGVAYRLNEGQVEVALISVGEKERWQLPKGLISTGESPENAAQREVREEAGIDTELLQKLDTVEYWFFIGQGSKRARVHKFVTFYLMRYLNGDVKNHDHEVNEARWFEIDQAEKILAFESERKMVQMARQRLGTDTSILAGD